MDKQRLLFLLDKYTNDDLTESEQQELNEWYAGLSLRAAADEPDSDELLREFRRRYAPVPIRRDRRRAWLAVAASVLVVVFAAGYFLSGNRSGSASSSLAQINRSSTPNMVNPGTNKAVLILDDGSQIDLDSSRTGVLARTGNAVVMKLADGSIGYRSANVSSGQAAMHTVRTPRGGEHALTLEDGTKVWLNASSLIRFPTVFAKERMVEIEGEAYFEVARSRGREFKVLAGKQEIRVLGTHFNINAYPDEGPQRVTLLEGSVRVSEGDYQTLLSPGQQSTLKHEGFQLERPDLEQVMAWKSGFFEFDHSSPETIMRMISRWYDVDVVYESKFPPNKILGGRISKYLPLDKVLKMLEVNGVKTTLNGKTLIVQG